ncbi:MAG TPA: hypothetical protein VNB94_08415 [Mycobacteriales bacterium]|nr:hypothetical protein [Mycobacteriales bacterium]
MQRSSARRTAAVLAAAAVLLGGAPGWGASSTTRGEQPAEVAAMALARLLPHDPASPAQGEAAGDHLPGSRYAYSIPRSTVDRPDTQDGRLVHVVYFLPADKPDESLDVAGVLDVSVAAQNAWLARESGGRRWRFDTFEFDAPVDGVTRRTTAYDITFVRSSRPASELHDITTIDDELVAAGLTQADKRYLIYAAVDGNGSCGSAYYPLTQPTNSAADGKYAGVYLDSSAGCRARDFASSIDSPGMTETIAQQEIMHNDGVVPLSAPHQCVPNYLHVCTPGLALTGLDPERFDILFPYVGVPLRDKKLDLGRDDYFSAPGTIRDLARSPFLTS